ncbi:NAD-dependent epimerase/dehydratase family protein [Microbacterium sp. RD1]|uniref:NAD-dependent epimerase/dehydratase family protein n=1 Tax=Microbacterium sp. RD1 TaxID=3457313 RepID=UPI003FA5C56D
MRVFVTGGTGWVGSGAVTGLLEAGYEVLALARSGSSAAALAEKGTDVLHGSLDDLDLLADAAARSEAVIHLAFDHDFAHFADSAEQEGRAIEAMGGALIGTGKPLLISSGLALIKPGEVVTEADLPPRTGTGFARKNDVVAASLTDRGVRISSVRLATTVHGRGDRMFMRLLADLALETGVSAYIGDGSNRWPAVHVSDAGRLYALALRSGASSRAYTASAEEAIAFRDIATAIGRALDVPVQSRPREHFGWLADFAAADAPASSARTREWTGWSPSGPSLLEDLATPGYFDR